VPFRYYLGTVRCDHDYYESAHRRSVFLLFAVIYWEIFFFFGVQEYEDKRVEEALQQEKTVKDRRDGGSKLKTRHEPFSFQDGMIYAVRY